VVLSSRCWLDGNDALFVRDFACCRVEDCGHNGEGDTMRRKITIDADDLTLVIAMIVSAVAISLALI
jgi:hypothetical protein